MHGLFTEGTITGVQTSGATLYLNNVNARGDVISMCAISTAGTKADYGKKKYDATGNVKNDSSIHSTPYGYSGEYTDETGLQYLRARYYDPRTMRFTQEDTWLDQGPNLYGCCSSDPVNNIDPSGHLVTPGPDGTPVMVHGMGFTQRTSKPRGFDYTGYILQVNMNCTEFISFRDFMDECRAHTKREYQKTAAYKLDDYGWAGSAGLSILAAASTVTGPLGALIAASPYIYDGIVRGISAADKINKAMYQAYESWVDLIYDAQIAYKDFFEKNLMIIMKKMRFLAFGFSVIILQDIMNSELNYSGRA